MAKRLLPRMARDWPFFANLLADVEMVLAKADMGIAERYSRLAGETGERLFPRILAEYDRTREPDLLGLRGIREPLEREPVLRRSIRLRNPYVDPISLLAGRSAEALAGRRSKRPRPRRGPQGDGPGDRARACRTRAN